MLRDHKRTTMNDTLVSLSKLRCKEKALVVEICGCGESYCRLAELGLVPGAPVEMLCCGRTCMLKTGRSRFSVRCNDLDAVMVERIA